MQNIIPIFLLIISPLVILNIFLIIYLYKIRKRFNLLFQGKKATDLEEILLNQVKKTTNQGKVLKEISGKVGELERISQKTFQKIGIIRFNPFSNVGGNQSFVIALLDSQNNGFVISSLYTREGNRVYAKPIKNSKSGYTLSDEEKEAISKALN